MRFLLLFIVACAVLMVPAFAKAGQAEAKDLARSYNCSVTGIKLVGQATGGNGDSTYEVTCALPAEATEDDKKLNGTMYIRCSAAMCTLQKKGA